MPRWLRILVAFLVLLAVSGAPAMAASVLSADPCRDGCSGDDEAEPEESTPIRDDCPDRGGLDCSPFCHACACFSPYAGAEMITTVSSVLLPTGEHLALAFADQLPPSQPPPGVFHPPRPA